MERSYDELEKWLGTVEDSAWKANAQCAAFRCLIGNLLAELDRAGVLEAAGFLTRLDAGIKEAGESIDYRDREGLRVVLGDLLRHFAGPSHAPPGTLFH